MALDGSEVEITTELVKNKLLQGDTKKERISMSNEIAYGSRSDERHFPQKFQREVICYGYNKKEHTLANCKKVLLTSKDDNWCIDSGTTNHMTNNKDLIQNLEISEGQTITVSDNSNLQATGNGT